MKKIFTFCFFAFALLMGTQTAIAQNKLEINAKASTFAKELRTQLKFDEVALEKVYIAYKQYGTKTAASNNLSVKAKQKLTASLQEGIKNAISEELYAKYLSITGQQEILAPVTETR